MLYAFVVPHSARLLYIHTPYKTDSGMTTRYFTHTTKTPAYWETVYDSVMSALDDFVGLFVA